MELSMAQPVGCISSPSAPFQGPSASVFFPKRFGINFLSENHRHGRLEPAHNLRRWDRYLQCNIIGPGGSFVAFCELLLQCSSSFVFRATSVSIKWNPVRENHQRCRRKHENHFTCFAAEGSSGNEAGTVTQKAIRTVTQKTVWPCLLPRPFIYSSSLSDVDSVQLSELWTTTLNVKRDPKKILKAIRHSFAFIVVLAEVEEASPSGVDRRLKTVGVGRAISDGTFIATICDVAVDRAYQRRGIGRRIVKKLIENMKKTGGPSGYAVFPPPIARRFFWMIGFRSDKKYKMMAYRGKEDVQLLEKTESEDRELVVTEAE